MKNLDVLRSIAVLVVVAAHCDSRIDGRFGVLIFFVHTSFVLMMSMERLSVRTQWPLQFYLQRIFRIFPLSILCVCAVLAARIPYTAGAEFHWPTPAVLLANLGLYQNVFEMPSLSPPMWSLPYEVQMYLLLPVVFWMVRKYGQGGAVLLAVIATIIAFLEKNTIGDPWLTKFFPCFMGGTLAYGLRKAAPVCPAWAWPICIALAGAICYGGGLTAPVQWFTCLGLGSVTPFFRDLGSGVVSRLAAWIARYSYGIYLSHLPIRWLCVDRWQSPGVLGWAAFAVLVPVVSFLLYHAIERPMIEFGRELGGQLGLQQPKAAIS